MKVQCKKSQATAEKTRINSRKWKHCKGTPHRTYSVLSDSGSTARATTSPVPVARAAKPEACHAND
eukprot:4719150-Amphidinium_carterae.3